MTISKLAQRHKQPVAKHTSFSVAPVIPSHVEEKYSVNARIAPLARKGIPLLPSCAHSYFFQLTKTWDSGTRAVRYRILKEFIAGNENATGPQLEHELNNGASLFLTRISAWLRLTYEFLTQVPAWLQSCTSDPSN